MVDTNSTKYRLAKLISRIFDVPIGGGILLLYMWYDFNHNVQQMSVYTLLAAIALLIIIPIIIIVVLIRVKLVDNWELTTKESRIYIYFIMTLVLTVSLVFVQITSLPNLLSEYLILGLFIVIAFGAINSFTKYKISVHMGVWTAVLITFAINYTLLWLLLSPVLVLIGYSRYIIRNHTLTELFLGTSVMAFIIIVYEFISQTIL